MIQVEERLESRLIDVARELRRIAEQARSRDSAVFLQSTAELVEKFPEKSGE